ncbi:MAG: hypothetical protein CL678_14415 [Bdellovibrionaceae bacterium]|nr:hypothetical protein [Pseudobdellovibrionaceae bacterium]|tara:strand:- start:205 stop:723 length:519 start_codon:yes stop_codon:yes gene_type:complete
MVNKKQPSVESLKEVSLLQIFSETEIQEILGIGKLIQYEALSNIVIEGEMSWGMYLVMDGSVGVFKSNRVSGNTYDVGQIDRGGFFGEFSLIDDGPRSATVRATTECLLFYISKYSFQAFLNKSTERKLKFYESCAHHVVNRLKELDDSYVITQYQLWKTALSTKGSSEEAA